MTNRFLRYALLTLRAMLPHIPPDIQREVSEMPAMTEQEIADSLTAHRKENAISIPVFARFLFNIERIANAFEITAGVKGKPFAPTNRDS